MNPNHLKDIRVLVIEDDEDDWLLTKKVFDQIPQSPFIVEWAANYEDGIRRIDEQVHDIYLIDYRLGANTGIDILRHVQPESRVQPFILITGASNSDLEWQSLNMAAADYLVKGSFDAILLSRTMYYALQRKFVEQQRLDHLIQLNQAKEEFISIASHQLRTPATGVKQYLGMVLEGFAGDVPDNQLPLLKKAYESNERQLRIISDLLKVAQVDSGKMTLHTSKVDINELLEDVIAEQKETLNDRAQNVSFHPLTGSAIVELDRDTFRMVFENITDNASKYSHEGTQIRVEVEATADEICINVVDQGVGVDKADQERIFDKFSRINNSLSTKVGGSGLGLYWAKQIVDMHGGSITYAPNKPSGSIFTICLPQPVSS